MQTDIRFTETEEASAGQKRAGDDSVGPSRKRLAATPPPTDLSCVPPQSPLSPVRHCPVSSVLAQTLSACPSEAEPVDEGGPADIPSAGKAQVPVSEAEITDQLYSKALDHLSKAKVVSAVSLMKKLDISYTIAHKLIEEMQQKGAIVANVKPGPLAVKKMDGGFFERYDETMTTADKLSDQHFRDFIEKLQHRKFLTLDEDLLMSLSNGELENAVYELYYVSSGNSIQSFFNIAERLQVVDKLLPYMCETWTERQYPVPLSYSLLRSATKHKHLAWAEFALLAGAKVNEPYATFALNKAKESREICNLLERYCPSDFKEYFDREVKSKMEEAEKRSQEAASAATSYVDVKPGARTKGPRPAGGLTFGRHPTSRRF